MNKRTNGLTILNDVEKIRSNDPSNMYNCIFDFPEQLANAHKLVGGWKINAGEFPDVRNIVLIGMGGSAIGGDLARSLLAQTLLVPFEIRRNYTLPEYVDDETLVIASSYSGNTEETLSALEDALERKSMIVALSTGGHLEEVARLSGIPILTLPSGLQPRAALAYSFVPILAFLEKVGLATGISDQVATASQSLVTFRDAYIEDRPVDDNPAKRMAARIHRKMPVIYGGPSLTDSVALRWKGQMCENGKNLAFANIYSEFNHNELTAWCDVIAPHKDHLVVIQLRDSGDHPKIKRRMDIVKGIVERVGIEVIDANSQGVGDLERMLSLVQLGDFVSYYLAILNDVDPTPVDAIETLKSALTKS